MELIQKNDVVCFSETKLDMNVTASSLNIPGFSTFRSDRNSRGGGVATFVKDTLSPVELIDVQLKYLADGIEASIVRITLRKPMKVIVINTYRPPNSPTSWFDKFDDMLLELMPMGLLTVLGDINADLLKPDHGPTKRLRTSIALAGLKIPSIFPTRICATAATCLDIIALPRELVCIEYSVIFNASSDHLPVQAVIEASPAIKPQPVVKRSYKNTDMSELRRRAANITLEQSSAASADALLASWQGSLIAILDDVAPIRKFPLCRKTCKWLSKDIRVLMQQRDAVARKIAVDKQNPVLTAKCKMLKRKVKSRMRRAAIEYGTDVLAANNSSDAWKFIREVTFSTTKGERTSMDASILNEQLAKTVSNDRGDELQIIESCDSSESFKLHLLDSTVVFHLLNTQKSKTATGSDGLSAALLKQLAPAIVGNIVTIMNTSIQQSVFPANWKRANVAAIWKNKGSKTDPANYRPISVLPVLSRLFEKAIARQLSQYCTEHNIIPVEQFGFRAQSSCESALVIALDSWMKEVDTGKVVGAILIDLSKAFDMVTHQRLLIDLTQIGCDQDCIRLFHSYLSGREQRVVNGNMVTEWKEVTRGVPQGSCLSPLLFNIYMRQLPRESQSETVQFADDITHSEADQDEKNVISRLTSTFQTTKNFCAKRDLIINASKTQLIIFKAPNRKIDEGIEMQVDNCPITPSDSVKLLGVTLDRHFTFGKHIDSMVKKCNGTIGMLCRAAPHLPRELLRLAYVSLIRSQLEYCSATFASASSTQLKKLDIVQKKASRVVCRTPRNAHSAPLLEALHLGTLGERRTAHVIKLVESILSGVTHPALHGMFHRTIEGRVENSERARIGIGRRRFSIYAKELANSQSDARSDKEESVNNGRKPNEPALQQTTATDSTPSTTATATKDMSAQDVTDADGPSSLKR
jgi:Reverse transcriptase (RNA-dependent DNA polymerase)